MTDPQPLLRLHNLRQDGLCKRFAHALGAHTSNKRHSDNLYTSQRSVPVFEHPVRRPGAHPPAERPHHLSLRPHTADVHPAGALRYCQFLRSKVVRIRVQAVRLQDCAWRAVTTTRARLWYRLVESGVGLRLHLHTCCRSSCIYRTMLRNSQLRPARPRRGLRCRDKPSTRLQAGLWLWLRRLWRPLPLQHRRRRHRRGKWRRQRGRSYRHPQWPLLCNRLCL
mmetsp:Transcript_37787/g.117444  ORF Transcript_37787/g.117444 Transcript_37787/m.117444 type:complete len:223 (+) Transcript_37787:606-1274(+)